MKKFNLPRKRLYCLFIVYVLIGVTFLSYAGITLYQDKIAEDTYWEDNLTTSEETQALLDRISKNAVVVKSGTYIENLDALDIKNSSFTMTLVAWFQWEGDDSLDMAYNVHPYKGKITNTKLLVDEHNGNDNYQQARYTVNVSKNYWTKRFPLESHQLRIYLESSYTADEVIFEIDEENSGVNPSLSISGYELVRFDVGSYAIRANTTFGDPSIPNKAVYSEVVTAVEINRDGMGTYAKCIIALLGTSLWVLIVMFINTKHRIDPLSMIPAALFGTVSNIMVGANLLPDALQLGLLEYVNVLGIMTILGGAISIINVNRIRTKYQNYEYATQLGNTMFYTVLSIALIGHILLPICAFAF